MTERTFDWRSRHDPKSLDYPIRSEIGTVEKKAKFWQQGAILDQGREGACVGFGWTGELLASPMPNFKVNSDQGSQYALKVYHEAQKEDEWAGENYSGTSVLAGAKTVHTWGYMDSYRWALSIEDVRDSVISTGPVVIGIPWYRNMYSTRESGLVEVGGDKVGGHCIVLTGYAPARRLRGEDWSQRFEVFRWRNSWGSDYGINGCGWIRLEDLRDLLKGEGEACVPIGRKRVDLTGKI